eukprot:357031-Chlamydomonas_euryale.AAC.3
MYGWDGTVFCQGRWHSGAQSWCCRVFVAVRLFAPWALSHECCGVGAAPRVLRPGCCAIGYCGVGAAPWVLRPGCCSPMVKLYSMLKLAGFKSDVLSATLGRRSVPGSDAEMHLGP